jgi:hypothetical protein
MSRFRRQFDAGFFITVMGFLFFSFLFGVWLTSRLVNNIVFNKDCGHYLGRASNASTVETTKEQIKIALDYVEKERLTEGFTSVLYRTPDEDIGYWYKNLSDDVKVLESLSPTTSELEKSNTLIRVRETLIGHGEKGDYLIIPDGISIYPHNTFFMFWGWGSAGMAVLFFCAMMFVKRDEWF